MISLRFFLFSLVFSCLCVGNLAPVRGDSVTAELVAAQDAVVPGQPFMAGILQRMEPGWHTYWQFPGIAGLPTKIDWDLPAGFSAGEIQWPLPKRSVLSGLLSYAYEGQVLLIVEITPPETLEAGTQVSLNANVSWLACKEVCIPGSQSVALTLPVQESAAPANEGLFTRFMAKVPQAMPPGVQMATHAGDQARIIQLDKTPPTWSAVDFYPLPAQMGELPPANVEKTSDSWTIRQSLPESIDPEEPLNGIVVVSFEDGTRLGYSLMPEPVVSQAPVTEAADSPGAQSGATSGTPEVSEVATVSLWWQLLLAFAGGLLLNIMPCVLPVLSLKILHFTEQAGQDRARIFQFGLAFAAGIFAWFMGLGVVSAMIKAGGSDVFWGTMFQNTGFTFSLAAVAFLFSLSLLGVFELVLPGSLTTRLSGAGGGGFAGAFGNGFFATILGSACTAPMLGPAVGWAFTQDPATILAIFFSIALGMSSPYLLLTANPGWMKWLPRPGVWMETFKQLMGFLLLPVVIWLVWVLGRQRGTEAMGWALAGLLSLGFLAWLIGRLQMTRGRAWIRVSGLVAALLICVVTLSAAWGGIRQSERGTPPLTDAALPTLEPADWETEIPWITYSPETLRAAMATDHPLFLDFTADWCLTCKWNEKTVLASREVREALEAAKVLPVKIDFTDQDPEIGKMIQQYGRAGVPVYVVIPTDRSQDVQVLPEFLTKESVLEALKQLPSAPRQLAASDLGAR